MKKKAIILALCVCMLTACGGNAESTTASTTTEAASEATTEAATEAATEVTTEATTEESAEPLPELKTVTLPDGTQADIYVGVDEYGNKNATVNSFYGVYSSGFEDDSDKSPDKFDVESYIYNGDAIDKKDIVEFDLTGTVKGCEAAAAKTLYSFWGDGENDYDFMESVLELNGKITMDGYLVYAMEDDYSVSTGDISFVPFADQLEDMPIPWNQYSNYGVYVTDGDFGYYGDTISISLGNILTGDGEVDPAVADKVDQSKKLTRVKATIENVKLSYVGQFGARNSAVLKDFEVIS